MQQIVPCLWFDNQAEKAAKFYVETFKNSSINETSYYMEEGQEIHGQAAGTVLTVEFELNGQAFTALNGGPAFKFNEAVSFQVFCDDQEEVDYYWNTMSAVPESEQCGWLKDKFGVSWQITPTILSKLLADPDKAKAQRVMKAMLQMKKLNISELEAAANAG